MAPGSPGRHVYLRHRWVFPPLVQTHQPEYHHSGLQQTHAQHCRWPGPIRNTWHRG